MTHLHAEHLTLAYERAPVVNDLVLRIKHGRITALVGPNGSGKSTVLKGLARLLEPAGGAVYLNGQAITQLSRRQLAHHISILPQQTEAPPALTVRDLIAHGRFPHRRSLGFSDAHDHEMIEWAITTTHLTEIADRPLTTLSGGQRQRAWIAMALAQDAPLLLLDEPTTFLDVAHQLEVLELLDRLNREQDRTIVMVLHELNHAARYAHHLIVMQAGRIATEGPPADVICPEVLRQVFGIEADIFPCPRRGVPVCVPHTRCTSAPDSYDNAKKPQMNTDEHGWV